MTTPISTTPFAEARSINTFHNPIKLECADPWMFYHDDFFYLMGTRGDCITISKARAVIELGTVPETLVWTDTAPTRCRNMWAPEAHFFRGRWYIYYAADDGDNVNHRMYVLESAGADPLGPYTYKAELDTAGWAIDGTVLQKDDGTLYFLWSQHGDGEGCQDPQNLYIASMSNPWTISSKKLLIATPSYDWETHGQPTNEGPQILHRNDKIHVIFSASHYTSPHYALGRITLDAHADLLDPNTWLHAKYPQPVFHWDDAAGVYGPGHNSFFTSPDGNEHWIAYHAVAESTGAQGENRTTRIQRFTWNADDTPNFGLPLALSTPIMLPGEDYKARWSEAEPTVLVPTSTTELVA